ncbi:MAG TPA: FecR family protein [Candidatus Angelobacter sp.]|nr:FecR family protein [Candidatus Angelobacter sp.]
MLRHSFMLRKLTSRWHLGGKGLRRSGLLLSIIFALVFSLAPFAHAQDADDEDGHDSHARIVRVSYVDGQVRLDNGHGYESATMNVPLTERDWLQTGSDGWAEVQLEDGSVIRLAPETVIAFTELGRSYSGGTSTTIDLDQGEAIFKITKHDGSDFRVTVKKNSIVLTHSGTFRVTSANSNPMEIAVTKGEVAVRDGESGDEVSVKKNETFVLNPNDVGQYALDKGTEADELDRWSTERDETLSAYASAGQGNIQSPYQYGANDLGYYGQYYDEPGYGQVWQPYGVNFGWDPFSNGYWSYAPGFGYTWVSSYPWGWMPYRYGRWVFINNRGWCWAPGGWNRWYSRPRWEHAPPGFHAPIPPADRRIVNGGPAEIHRQPSRSGDGGRNSGPIGGRVADRDGDNRNPGRQGGNAGGRRTLTNDDVQARVPRTDVPATAPAQPPATIAIDPVPKIGSPRPTVGVIDRGHDADRGRGDREQPREPVRRSTNDASASAPSQPVRQYNPPPQPSSPPPSRQPEHQYTPPAVVHQQSAPPPPPVVHQPAPPPAPAQAQRQSAPPPESHSRSSDDGGRGGRPK